MTPIKLSSPDQSIYDTTLKLEYMFLQNYKVEALLSHMQTHNLTYAHLKKKSHKFTWN